MASSGAIHEVEDEGDRWWVIRKEEVDRVKTYIAALDNQIRSALSIYPSEALVTAIAAKAQTTPRIVRRIGAEQRVPMSYFHFIYHKQRGILCQPRQLGREEEIFVGGLLPYGFPPVPFSGRLDADTEGLMLFSDNGKLLHGLMHPKETTGILKVQKLYFVECSYQIRRISKEALTEEEEQQVMNRAIASMRTPIDIKGAITEPAEVSICDRPKFVDDIVDSVVEPLVKKRKKCEASGETLVTTTLQKPKLTIDFWLAITINEGKNRQIRRLCKRANLKVLRLIRSGIGPISLGSLKAGQARALVASEVEECYRMAGMPEAFPSVHCPVPPQGEDLIDLLPPYVTDN